jgi:GH24 family phage-related lysozyme (muramidase)
MTWKGEIPMKINDAGLNLVKSFEGCRLTAYKCPAGVWTIGYGHTGNVDGKTICEGMKISEAKATELLKKDMAKFENAVMNCSALTFKPNENQFSALVSFAFNCGAGNLKTLVKGRSAIVVAEKLLLYNKANGKALNGLTRRRKAERELFLKTVSKTETTGSSNSSEIPNNSKKTVAEIAKEVIAGKWGTGAERKRRLIQAGYDFMEVQKKVNALLNGPSYYSKYTGTSAQIDVVLRAIGVPEEYVGGWAKRKPIATANGVPNYTGKAGQNRTLIALAKSGKLKKV